MGKVLLHLTHSKDDVERATLAFVVANAGLTAGQDVTVLLTVEGVRCAVQGYADGLQSDGYAPLAELMQKFIDNDGALWVCGRLLQAAQHHRRATDPRRADGRRCRRHRGAGQRRADVELVAHAR